MLRECDGISDRLLTGSIYGTRCICDVFVPGPVREGVEAEEGDAVGVDGETDGEAADYVHHHTGLHQRRNNVLSPEYSTSQLWVVKKIIKFKFS